MQLGNTGTALRGATMIRFSLVVLLLLVSWPASAQDDGQWIRKSLRSSCEWWETCRYRYRTVRQYHRHYQLHAVRVHGYHRDERRYSPECRDLVIAVGEERYGRDRAKESAEQAWMENVRSKCGARFMDLRNADRGTWECGRSSTGNRASEKTAESVGKFLEQCTLRAIPRRAELEPVGKD
jgi:hypothetical protein